METGPSKISNVEWALVICALFTIDVIQVILEWLLIGLLINPFIDIIVGMSFAFYLHIRGESLGDAKRLASFIITFFLELVPGLDELPLWGLEGIYAFALSRANRATQKEGGGQPQSTPSQISAGNMNENQE